MGNKFNYTNIIYGSIGGMKKRPPRPGIEPGSPAIRKERRRLVTGGYTDHYTNEELDSTEKHTLYTYFVLNE